MKKKKLDIKAIFNTKNLIILNLFIIVLLFYRKWFFMAVYMYMTYWVLTLKPKYGISAPFEIYSFGIIMCSYVYGVKEGIIVSTSSLILLTISGRVEFNKLIVNVIAIPLAYLAYYLSAIGVGLVMAGMISLMFRIVAEYGIKIGMLQQKETITRMSRELINIPLYLILFSSFGNILMRLMAV